MMPAVSAGIPMPKTMEKFLKSKDFTPVKTIIHMKPSPSRLGLPDM